MVLKAVTIITYYVSSELKGDITAIIDLILTQKKASNQLVLKLSQSSYMTVHNKYYQQRIIALRLGKNHTAIDHTEFQNRIREHYETI